MSEDRLIPRLQSVCACDPHVELALLFGSRARGRAREDSDIDVAVVADEGFDLLALAAELSRAAGLEVDVVEIRNAGYPLLKVILRDGIPIHQRDRHAWARFRTCTILQLETDRPGFERMRDGYLRKLAEGGNG